MTGTSVRTWRLLAGRVGVVAASLVLGQVLTGVTYVVAARGMNPAELGLIATCFAIGTVASTIFDNGLTSYLIREVGCGAMPAATARGLVRTKRRLTPLLVVPTTTACLLILTTRLEAVVLGMVGWALWEAQSAGSLLRAQERFAKAASAQLAGRSVGLVLTTVLVLVGPAERALPIGLVSAFTVEAVIGRLCLGAAGTAAARRQDLFAAQRRSLSFGLVALAAIGQQLDTPLVTAGGGPVAGGIYAAAGRLIGPLLFMSSSLALVGPPWLARARNDAAALRTEERRIRRLAVGLALGPLVAAAVGPVLIPVLLGRQYADSGQTFSILAIGAIFSTLSQGFALILQNRGAEKTVGTTIGTGLVLGLVVTYLAAQARGPVWAALGFAASQLYIIVRLAIATRTDRSRHSETGGDGR